MIYKVTLHAETEEGQSEYIDLYLNVSKIDYFYIPIDNEDYPHKGINICVGGITFTILQEESIMNYLLTEWVNKAIE